MSDTKFTPGPWHIEEWDGESRPVLVGGDKHYALVPAKGAEVHEDQTWANAHLCAAAPDLYAALEAMFAVGTTSECHEGPCGHKACGLAKAALAKARGE